MGAAAYAQTITIPTAEYGDTFSGQPFTLLVNDVAKDLTGAKIELTFDTGDILTTVDSGGLTITDAAAGEWQIDAQVITVRPGTHSIEVKFTFADGSIKTYAEGTWKITR